MLKTKFTLNPKQVKNPSIEISSNFETDFMSILKESTSFDLDIIKAEREYYIEDGGR